MKIYICKDFKCHASDDGTMSAVETDFFDGKCAEYINGYCYIPEGQSWIAPDGTVYLGEMIFPWKDWNDLDTAQMEYERQQLSAYEQALSEIEAALGVSV